ADLSHKGRGDDHRHTEITPHRHGVWIPDSVPNSSVAEFGIINAQPGNSRVEMPLPGYTLWRQPNSRPILRDGASRLLRMRAEIAATKNPGTRPGFLICNDGRRISPPS